jgi:hypothetical protein
MKKKKKKQWQAKGWRKEWKDTEKEAGDVKEDGDSV